jgi:hypothetical protein
MMYSRNLHKPSHSGYIFDILLPFSRRTHRVRTAKMSLYIKNLSQNSSIRKFREYIMLKVVSQLINLDWIYNQTYKYPILLILSVNEISVNTIRF